MSQTREDSFTRVMGLTHVTAGGVGVIIGAGIYILIGPATEQAGGLVWLSMLLASVLCALTAFSYMELSSMFPKAGSEHEFARQVFPSWVAFITGWGMTIALAVASAAVSLGFARYLNVFTDVNEHFASLLLLAFVCFVSIMGMQHAKWLVIVLSVIQISGLLIVIAVGAHHIGDVSLTTGNGWGGVLGGASIIFFAYIGFDEVITLAEETHDPHRTIPRALILALGISTILYVLVAIVAVSVLGPDALAVAKHPLTDVMNETLGGASVKVVAGVALATTANTTFLATTAASRMVYSMGATGVIPAWWARVQDKRSPRAATLAISGIAMTLSLMGGLQLLAAATNALIYLMFLVVNVVVIILRKQKPNTPRPFKISGAIGWMPVIPCVGIAATLLMSQQLEFTAVLAAVGLLITGLVPFLFHQSRSSRSRTLHHGS